MIRKKEPAADGTTAITRSIYDAAGNKTKEITPNNYDSTKDTASLASTMTGMSYSYYNMKKEETSSARQPSFLFPIGYYQYEFT